MHFGHVFQDEINSLHLQNKGKKLDFLQAVEINKIY